MWLISNQSWLFYSVATSESEDQVKGRFLLDVVVRKGSAILKLLSSEDESLFSLYIVIAKTVP